MKWPASLDPRLVLSAFFGGLIGCAAMGQIAGALGFLAGVAGTGMTMVGTAGVVRIIADSEMSGLSKFGRASLFFFQFGLFAALAFWVHKVGTPAPECFLMGVGLVYIGLVIWAQAKQAEPD